MFKYVLPLLLLITVFACTRKIVETAARSGDNKSVAYGQSEELAPGQSLSIERGAPAFTFVEVVSDSRCPRNVNCIRAGEAVIRVEDHAGKSAEYVLEADAKRGARFSVPDGLVTILGLDPYPVSRVETTPEAYRLRVTVAKAAAQ